MKKTMAVILAGSTVTISYAAQAPSWGAYVGTGGGYRAAQHYGDDGDGFVRSVCSGQRAHALESRLRHEQDEDEIDDGVARRIHFAIDRLETRQEPECDEGDWRAIRDIAYRYDRIGDWIRNEADGGDRRGW